MPSGDFKSDKVEMENMFITSMFRFRKGASHNLVVQVPRCRNQLKELLPQIFVTVTDTVKTRTIVSGNTHRKHTRRNCFDDVIKR